MKSVPAPWSLAYKKRAYSPNRIKYPLKRVDWDPNGERNTQNRGKSKFVRISWDEATDLIAAEIRRVHKEYGPLAILVQGDGHGECKMVHAPHGCSTLLLDKMGGFTQQVRNPDSWEGWYWGAKHVWGKGFIGMMAPADNVVKDITENSDMVVVWGGDPETTPWGFRGQLASRLLLFLDGRSASSRSTSAPTSTTRPPSTPTNGSRSCPTPMRPCNWQSCISGSPKAPTTRSMSRPTPWASTRSKAYVLGKEDGIPKTPKWASAKCGVPAWTIKALAARLGQEDVTIGHYFGGGMARGPYSTSPPGWSRPAGHAGTGQTGRPPGADRLHGHAQEHHRRRHRTTWAPSRTWSSTPAGDRLLKPHRGTPTAWGKQLIPKTLIEEAIKNGTVDFWGTGGHEEPTADQFKKYTYPIPKEEGGTEIHMMWTDTPCRHDLLELRQRHRRSHAQSQDRMHRGPASLAGERLPLRRYHPAGQHHPRGGRHHPRACVTATASRASSS